MAGVSQQMLLGASGGGVTGLQFISSNSSVNSASWSYPAGWQAGDLVVFNAICVGSAPTTPPGFSAHVPFDPGVAIFGCYKLLVGGESGAIALPTDGNGHYGQATLWRGVGGKIQAVAAGSWTAVAGGSSAPPPINVVVSGSAPMLILGFKSGSDNAISITLNPAADGDLGTLAAFIDVRTVSKLYAASQTPVNNTVTGGDDGGANSMAAGFFRCT
jgi:hypothetical protein